MWKIMGVGVGMLLQRPHGVLTLNIYRCNTEFWPTEGDSAIFWWSVHPKMMNRFSPSRSCWNPPCPPSGNDSYPLAGQWRRRGGHHWRERASQSRLPHAACKPHPVQHIVLTTYWLMSQLPGKLLHYDVMKPDVLIHNLISLFISKSLYLKG